MKTLQLLFIGLIILSFPSCDLGGGSSKGNGPGPIDTVFHPTDSTIVVVNVDTLERVVDIIPITEEDVQFADAQLQSARGGKKHQVPPPNPTPVPTTTDPTAPGIGGAVIFLDFDGGNIDPSTGWQAGNVAPSTFSEEQKESVLIGAQEAYAPYNVIVTRTRTTYDTCKRARLRVMITPTSAWANLGGSTGVSWVGIMWNNPARNATSFVFENNCIYRPDFVSYIIAHESGHAIGLQHQSVCSGGTVTVQYRDGCTMGVPWQTRGWVNGINKFCTNQDDVKILTQQLTLR